MRNFAFPFIAPEPGDGDENAGGGPGDALIEQKPPSQGASKAPDTPHPPVLEPDSAQQTFSRLNEAARRIASEEAAPNRRLPRASRLSSFRDISAEITRASTPLPNYTRILAGGNSQELDIPDSYPGEEEQFSQDADAGQPEQWEQLEAPGTKQLQEASLPDLWPWFDNDAEEKEGEDIWANRTDPLITRHRPNSSEAALIEQEDIRRALAEGVSTGQMPVYKAPRRKSPLRNIFIALAIFAIVALSIDGLLLSLLSGRSHAPTKSHSSVSVASLTLSVSQVTFVKGGPTTEQIKVQLANFAKNARVVLTHDIQEPIQLLPGEPVVSQTPAMVNVGATGSATVTLLVTTEWGFGPHTLYAQDVRSLNTASTGLLVIGPTQSAPAHLEITASVSSSTPLKTLDLGPGVLGSVSTLSITLKNSSLSGSITWSASSNQSWLLISPTSGTFNQSQTIDIAVQRSQMNETNGLIKFYSNVDAPQAVSVTMTVTPVPTGSSVVALSPAALSFVTADGSTVPPCQTLTLSNPSATTALDWSLTATSSSSLGTAGNWLTASPSSGSIAASSDQQVCVYAQSAGLLPGAYLGSLQISAPGAVDSAQTISVSLTVQPHCGLTTSASFLTFTAVQGKTSAGPQSLGLNSTASCNGAPLPWSAQVSTPSWLSVSPTSGQLTGTASTYLTVSVNPASLKPQKQPYTGFLVFSTPHSTQTVLISFSVQSSSASAPVMDVALLNLNFSSTQGQPSPKGQVVTITNDGGSVLNWNSNAQPFSNSWLYVSAPTSGQLLAGQTGTVTINVDTSKLSSNTYAGQVTLNGTDSTGSTVSGSPQVISVNLVVQPPCTLAQPSLSSLAFTAVQGQSSPAAQSVLITGSGNCAWPLLITTTVSSGANWLPAPQPNNSIGGNGQSTSLVLSPDSSKLKANAQPYTAQVTITATDSAGLLAQGSGQTIDVSLTVQRPCTFVSLSQANAKLTFTMFLGATSATTLPPVPLSVKGTCAHPITYSVTPATNAAWLTFPATLTDSGSGSSLGVSINAAAPGLTVNTYRDQLTITAVDTNANKISGSLVINVTLIVSAPTVSGTVYACTGTPPACLTQTPLPSATITVLSGTTTVATVTADASGNYTINLNTLPVGNYTVNVSGTLQSVVYSALGIPLNLTGNQNLNLNAY